MDRAALLSHHPLLRRLSPTQINHFVHAGEFEMFQADEEIVIEGTLGDSFYLILSGSATVHSKRTTMALATLKTGDFFGEMSLLEPAMRSATVRAAELSEVFRISNFHLTNFLSDDSGALSLMLVTMVRTLSERLRKTNDLVGSVEQLSVLLGGSNV